MVQATEAAEGSALEFQITLTPALPYDLTVNWGTTDGTAFTSLGDYSTTTSGTITFLAGETTKNVAIDSYEDSIYERSQDFTFGVSAIVGNGTAADAATGTILDNDPKPTVIIAEHSLVEGNWGAVYPPPPNFGEPISCMGGLFSNAYGYEVTLSGATEVDVIYEYSTTDNASSSHPATADVDYSAVSGILTFYPSGNSEWISIFTINDCGDEFDEDFRVSITDPDDNDNEAFSLPITIIDDDAAPIVTISNSYGSQNITEGTGIDQELTFTVSLSTSSDYVVTVDWSTSSSALTWFQWNWPGWSYSDAMADFDYLANSGTITFNPGDPLTQTITVTIEGDDIDEEHERFNIVLSNPIHAAFASTDNPTTTVLVDDDDTSEITIEDASVIEATGNWSTVEIPVSLSTPNSRSITVPYYAVFMPSPAADSSDFSASFGPNCSSPNLATITFTPGQITAPVNIGITQSNSVNGNYYSTSPAA